MCLSHQVLVMWPYQHHTRATGPVIGLVGAGAEHVLELDFESYAGVATTLATLVCLCLKSCVALMPLKGLGSNCPWAIHSSPSLAALTEQLRWPTGTSPAASYSPNTTPPSRKASTGAVEQPDCANRGLRDRWRVLRVGESLSHAFLTPRLQGSFAMPGVLWTAWA